MRAGLLLLSFVAGSAWATPLFVPAVASTATDTSTVKSVAATCPAGRVAISGGAQITGNGQGVTLTTSGPEGAPTAPNQWYGVAIGHGGTGSWGLTVNALCAVPAVAQQIQVATVTRNASAGATFVDAFASCPAGTSIIAGGARVYGAIDGAALTTSGPEGTTQWYGVATILPNVNTGMRVDAFCLPDAVWNQRIAVSTSNASPAGGRAANGASCGRGTYALGGGARVAGTINGVGLWASAPSPLGAPPLSWETQAAEFGATLGPWSLYTTAFCLRP